MAVSVSLNYSSILKWVQYATSQDVSVGLEFALHCKMHWLQHGTPEKTTVLQVLFWQEASLPTSLLGPLRIRSEALGGDVEQADSLQIHNFRYKWGSGVVMGVWEGRRGGVQLWCRTSSTVLGPKTLSEWAESWWTERGGKRWGGGGASVSL